MRSKRFRGFGCGGRPRNFGRYRLRCIRLRPMRCSQVDPGQQLGDSEGPDSHNLSEVKGFKIPSCTLQNAYAPAARITSASPLWIQNRSGFQNLPFLS